MKEHKKFTIVFILSQIIIINNFLEMYYCYNEKITLLNSASIFLFSIYYIYIFFIIVMKRNLAKYFSIVDNIYFYGEVATKLMSIILSIIYIRSLRNNEYGEIVYIVQIMLLILNLILGLKVINILKKLSNNNLENIKNYEFRIDEKICNKDEYNEALLCFGCVFIIGIINFDYSFIIVIPTLKYSVLLIFIINLFVIVMAKRYFERKIFCFENLKLKFYKRSIVYNTLTNIVCFITCILISNIEIRFYVVASWLIINFIYCLKKVMLPVSRIVNGMEKYLNK